MGSTGSIGRQTLDVVKHYPEKFNISSLTANNNWQLLATQAFEFRPSTVVIGNSEAYPKLKEALEDTGIEVLCGSRSLSVAATLPEVDIVVGAVVGYSGLASTIAALEAGKTMALANKETLVVGGEIIEEIVKRKGKRILPVDSEHSAIFQCLMGEDSRDVSKIILTASGGPFRTFSMTDLEKVTVSQALHHPNWDMGAKVTIDSATMMNKGFEMIEARWLFNRQPADIDVVVHPESIVHSMVEFVDGSVKAQLGLPDMRLPIEVALSYPGRIDLAKRLDSPLLDLTTVGSLSFEKPDFQKFPLLHLAYEVAEQGGLLPAIMNAANEVAVKFFLESKISFTDINRLVDKTVSAGEKDFCGIPVTPESISIAHSKGTDIALDLVKAGLGVGHIHNF